ncbi:hypothetical protein E4U53_000187 [Claviceps sorghi]|nr:hypothetical protein E4U53_000187 [Claviceps sorghi]
MQFSTSTALASLAVFAGQTLALCDTGFPETAEAGATGQFFYTDCTSLGGPHWRCGSSRTTVSFNTNDRKTWTVNGGPAIIGGSISYVSVRCGSEKKVMWCTPGDHRDFEFSCPGSYKVEAVDLS